MCVLFLNPRETAEADEAKRDFQGALSTALKIRRMLANCISIDWNSCKNRGVVATMRRMQWCGVLGGNLARDFMVGRTLLCLC